MERILEVKNLTKEIGKKKILDDISFNIDKGCIFGIVGVNGAGKSTLLKTIVGLYKPTKGSIKINGYDNVKQYEKAMESVGSVIETPAMYNYLTGEENLEVFKMMFKGVDTEKVREIVKLVSLEGSVYKKLKKYSLGMRQRLGLATALMNNPKLLILDEPTNGLDPLGIKDLREFLSTLKNTTIIISSHILSEIEALCDKVMFLDKGRVVEIKELNKNEVKKKLIKFDVDNYRLAYSILSEYDISRDLKIEIEENEIPILNRELVNSGINVYRICESSSNLESEFLSKISKGTEQND